MTITAQDHARISAAIRAVEARTSGELVCVLARASSEYAAYTAIKSAKSRLAKESNVYCLSLLFAS